MRSPLSWSLDDAQARRFYHARPGLVAFVDESYRALPEGSAYIMTGVIADTSQFSDYRRGLVESLQSNTFHAAPARTDNPMAADGVEIVNTLVQQRSDVLASVMVGTQDLEDDDVKSRVRQQVLGALARQLYESWGVNTIVADHLVDGDRQREDEVTMRRVRDAGVPVELLHSHPGREKMLWTADATAWAVQRDLLVPWPRKWENRLGTLADRITLMDAATGRTMPRPMPRPGDEDNRRSVFRRAVHHSARAQYSARLKTAQHTGASRVVPAQRREPRRTNTPPLRPRPDRRRHL